MPDNLLLVRSLAVMEVGVARKLLGRMGKEATRACKSGHRLLMSTTLGKVF